MLSPALRLRATESLTMLTASGWHVVSHRDTLWSREQGEGKPSDGPAAYQRHALRSEGQEAWGESEPAPPRPPSSVQNLQTGYGQAASVKCLVLWPLPRSTRVPRHFLSRGCSSCPPAADGSCVYPTSKRKSYFGPLPGWSCLGQGWVSGVEPSEGPGKSG